MLRRLIASYLAAGLLLCFGVPPASAWDSFGHTMVAYVAYDKLTPQTRTRANALVKMNPTYKQWVKWLPANTTPANRNRMIFAIAATWPDQIKDDPAVASAAASEFGTLCPGDGRPRTG